MTSGAADGRLLNLGDKNWWLPKWLDKVLPDVAGEGHVHDPASNGRTAVVSLAMPGAISP
jgi:uncharacterized membrane protein YdfJ with MMPL/SSD domain